jgi:hypothetical protein
MGGAMKTARKVIDPMNIMDPGGILPGPKGGKFGTPSWQSSQKKRITQNAKSDAVRDQLYQMMKDRQSRITRQLKDMPTEQSELQKQQDAQKAIQPIEQVAPVDQNATNEILNPAPAVTPTTVSSVAAPTQAMASPTAPLANEYTGMGPQKTNKFAMPSTRGLTFGGT